MIISHSTTSTPHVFPVFFIYKKEKNHKRQDGILSCFWSFFIKKDQKRKSKQKKEESVKRENLF